MVMSQKRYFSSAILCIVFCFCCLIAYAQKPVDAVAEVPELDSFHEVIFKIWHEAWPKKDVAMLRSLQPEVEKGITQVAAAKLPGILREKKSAWDEGVSKLQATGSEYKVACGAKDDARLLSAAEKLHSQFEALMRVTRPVMKELEAFHSVLYMLYHHYMPAFDIEKIRSSVPEMKQTMAALNAATLPERFKAKEAEFQSARATLAKSVDALISRIQSNDQNMIKAAISEMHTNYESLAACF
jgi:hypothetical protein